ncbi:hypothetical protein H5410_055335 [Solanum commersonii]|uniref:RNA polymerase Rpb4/RPC9 core domain-containing protein n=1 Tax=Solanum commersonii TaxID=4109 RepID=A0A9J5WHB3_SOLCO|nr:hypothetical protein H5410_055335 [Solanum commersonii]
MKFEENVVGVDFLKGKCLMNSEVALILQHKYEKMCDEHSTNQVFEKSLQYVKRFSQYNNPHAVTQVRHILSSYLISEVDLCVLGNLCPKSVEESIAMVQPKGLARLDDEAIKKILTELSLLKKFDM